MRQTRVPSSPAEVPFQGLVSPGLDWERGVSGAALAGGWAGRGVGQPGMVSSSVDGAWVSCDEVPETRVLAAKTQALPGRALLLQGTGLAGAAGHLFGNQSR